MLVSEVRSEAQRIEQFLDWLNWRRIVELSLLGAALIGVAVFVFAPRRYSATTSLLLSERPDVMTTLTGQAAQSLAAGGLVSFMGQGGPLARLEAIFQSRSIGMQLVHKHKLAQRLALDEEKTLGALAEMTRIKSLKQAGLKIGVTCRGPSRLWSWLGLRYTFGTEEAKNLCADLANDYVDALDTYVTETSVQQARETRQFIAQRLKDVEEGLEQTEDRLEELQTGYGLIDPDSKAGQLIHQTEAMNQAWAEATALVEGLDHSLHSARAQLAHEDAMRIAQEVTARNPVIAKLEEKLANLETELAAEREAGKSRLHPDVEQMEAAIGSIERQLEDVQGEVRQQVSRQTNPTYDALMSKTIGLEVELAGTRARKATYQAQLHEVEAKLAELPPVMREYVRLSRQRQLQAELLTTLATRLELAAIEEQRESSGRFEVLDAAVPPLRKSGPSSVRSAGVTFVLLVTALGLIWGYRRGIFASEIE